MQKRDKKYMTRVHIALFHFFPVEIMITLEVLTRTIKTFNISHDNQCSARKIEIAHVCVCDETKEEKTKLLNETSKIQDDFLFQDNLTENKGQPEFYWKDTKYLAIWVRMSYSPFIIL